MHTPGTKWGTHWLGEPHEHHRQIGSTNDRALAWARTGAPGGALVTADQQTAGRGTRGRTWVSPADKNVYASIVLCPNPKSLGGPQALSSLSLAIGLGIHRALSPNLPGVRLKWPNDLVVEQPSGGYQKLAGILCETRWLGQAVQVVAGFGINVHCQAFPGELQAIATSMEQCSGKQFVRHEVLTNVLREVEVVLDRFLQPGGGFAAIAQEYRQQCVTLGQWISRPRQVRGKTVALEGEVVGLTPLGALQLRTTSGELVEVQSVAP